MWDALNPRHGLALNNALGAWQKPPDRDKGNRVIWGETGGGRPTSLALCSETKVK
jgi:hypothetical protein